MNQNIRTTLYSIILASLILAHLPYHACQDPQYLTCGQPFECGNIRNLSYPFWEGTRSPSCGYPGFELDCQGDIPLLNISSILYQVLEVNYTTKTLRLARQDLWNSMCPTILRETTLDSQRFHYSSSDQNVTLHYGCTISPVQLPNRLIWNCSSGYSFYLTEEIPANLAFNFSCRHQINVPVNQYAAQELTFPGVALRDALASGFFVRWLANNSNCDNCLQSGGVCGHEDSYMISDFEYGSYNYESIFTCYCKDQAYALTCNNTDVIIATSRQELSTVQKIVTAASILGSTCTIILAVILICHFVNKCTSNVPNKESNKNVETFILYHGSLALKRYTYTEIKKVTKSFSEKLGHGGFGSVYKGTLPDGRLVAIKVLKETNSIGEEFTNEVVSISRMSHVNIVNLMGFCYDKHKRALIYEFMPNKSLDKFISGSLDKDRQLGWKKLYGIAMGVARGLEYIHRGCNTRIVHFDIKPQNILLDEKFCPKISDFGLAKLCRKKQSILTSVFGTRGTIGYIAPEVFCRNLGAVSHKSDVYSYGMMVLEMAGARNIEEDGTVESSENYFPDKVYEESIVRNMESFDEIMSGDELETVRKMFLIGFWCIQTVPSDRPSMSKVVEMFEGSIESIQIPPKPFLSSPKLSLPEYSSSFVIDLGTESSE